MAKLSDRCVKTKRTQEIQLFNGLVFWMCGHKADPTSGQRKVKGQIPSPPSDRIAKRLARSYSTACTRVRARRRSAVAIGAGDPRPGAHVVDFADEPLAQLV
jgi:hypothetical protein